MIEEAREMNEPIFIAQTGEPEHLVDEYAWVRNVAAEAKAKGCCHARVTRNDTPPSLLFEAWTTRPESEGEPRWSFM